MSEKTESGIFEEDLEEIYEPQFKRIHITGDENLQQLQEKLQDALDQNSFLQKENDKLKANILWNKAKEYC